MKMLPSEVIDKYNPCYDAKTWIDYNVNPKLDTKANLEQKWLSCENPLWMFWIINKILKVKAHKRIVLTACSIAKFVSYLIPKEEKRPLEAITLTEKWANGDESVTLEMLRNAGDAAEKAASNHTYPFSDAAHAAVYVVSATFCAEEADTDACDVICDVIDAYSPDEAARKQIEIECCNEIRKFFTFEELYQKQWG